MSNIMTPQEREELMQRWLRIAAKQGEGSVRRLAIQLHSELDDLIRSQREEEGRLVAEIARSASERYYADHIDDIEKEIDLLLAERYGKTEELVANLIVPPHSERNVSSHTYGYDIKFQNISEEEVTVQIRRNRP